MIEDGPEVQDDNRWPYYHRGWRYLLEGFYIWLGKRLPPGLVFYASVQFNDFAFEHDMPDYHLCEIQSAWLDEKMQ